MSAPMLRPLTLVEATLLAPAEWDRLCRTELNMSDADRERVGAVWLWLCGVPSTAPEAADVREEATNDTGLAIALTLPAAEFVEWFRVQDWELFNSAERTGSQAWGWTVIDRARGQCAALGQLAGQIALQPG